MTELLSVELHKNVRQCYFSYKVMDLRTTKELWRLHEYKRVGFNPVSSGACVRSKWIFIAIHRESHQQESGS